MKNLIVFMMAILLFNVSYASNFDINEFTNALSKFDNEFISSSDYSKIISDISSGKFTFDYKKVFSGITKFFSKELKNNIGILIQIIIIAILCSFLNNLQSEFSNAGISKLSFYMCYIVIITIISGSFLQIIVEAQEAITLLIAFMNSFLPILTGIIISTGAINTTNIIYPIIMFVTNSISNFLNVFMVPILMMAFVISIVANISKNIRISKMSKLIKNVSLWVLGIVLTLFVGVVSLEGSVASTVDGITVKTAKFMFSNGVPVVGKLLGDSIDTVIGSTLVLKDAIGFIGIVVLLTLVLMPVFKIGILLFLYNIVVALIEPFAEPKIIGSINETIDVGKIVVALLIAVSIMFLVGLVAMLKISNNVAMYR